MDDVETMQREADEKKKSAEQMIIDNGRETSKIVQAIIAQTPQNCIF